MAGNGSDLAETIYGQALDRVAKGDDATEIDRLIVMNYELAKRNRGHLTVSGQKLDRLVDLIEHNPKTLREHIQDKGPWATAGAVIVGAAVYIMEYLSKR